MYTKPKFSLNDLIHWTRLEVYVFLFWGLIPTALWKLVGFHWLQLPWTPIALVGTAVAFLIGFQSNAAYGRIWEARKIWGGIVNTSRSFGVQTLDLITKEHAKDDEYSEEQLQEERAKIFRRHIAWMAALRHAMRKQKPWEDFRAFKTNREWDAKIHVPEFKVSLEDDLSAWLDDDELSEVMAKTNKSTALLRLQSRHLRQLKEKGYVWEFAFLQLESLITEMFTLQGKSERIKNFPYPRHFATLGTDFVRVFILLLPFGVIPGFAKVGEELATIHPVAGNYFVWLSVPFVAVVAWVFHTMHRIGTVGENPFAGGVNDVPISAISRGIEVDMLEMLETPKEEIPSAYPSPNDTQM